MRFTISFKSKKIIQKCKEYCKIFGLTGCEWVPSSGNDEPSKCSTFMEKIAQSISPSPLGTKCFPFEQISGGKIIKNTVPYLG